MHWSIPATTELSIVVLIQWFEIDKWCKRGQAYSVIGPKYYQVSGFQLIEK